jgi:DivIVA domain-containing protein
MGYDIIDVDAFLDVVEQYFEDAASDPTELVAAVRQARFHMSTERAYEPEDVDAFLDRLESSLTPPSST